MLQLYVAWRLITNRVVLVVAVAALLVAVAVGIDVIATLQTSLDQLVSWIESIVTDLVSPW